MPAACALNFDDVTLAQRNRIGPVLCSLVERRWMEVSGVPGEFQYQAALAHVRDLALVRPSGWRPVTQDPG